MDVLASGRRMLRSPFLTGVSTTAWFDEPVDERDGAETWHALPYDEAWAPFDARFHFKPDYYERSASAILLPEDSIVIDLAPIFDNEGARFAAGEAAVNAAALRAFVWEAGDADLTALDWQHTPYRYSPAVHVLSDLDHLPVPVFPNGDYFIHASDGLEWGTFGHPWQQTLTVWGRLIHTLGKELLTWLPLHPQSRATL